MSDAARRERVEAGGDPGLFPAWFPLRTSQSAVFVQAIRESSARKSDSKTCQRPLDAAEARRLLRRHAGAIRGVMHSLEPEADAGEVRDALEWVLDALAVMAPPKEASRD